MRIMKDGSIKIVTIGNVVVGLAAVPLGMVAANYEVVRWMFMLCGILAVGFVMVSLSNEIDQVVYREDG